MSLTGYRGDCSTGMRQGTRRRAHRRKVTATESPLPAEKPKDLESSVSQLQFAVLVAGLLGLFHDRRVGTVLRTGRTDTKQTASIRTQHASRFTVDQVGVPMLSVFGRNR